MLPPSAGVSNFILADSISAKMCNGEKVPLSLCSVACCFYFLYLCLKTGTLGYQHISVGTSSRRMGLDGKVYQNRLVWQKSSLTAIKCGIECAQDDRCAGMFYNTLTGSCQAHSITMGYSSNPVSETGSRYYVQPHGEDYIGDSCVVNANCYVTNSECRNETCWCSVGYSFSPATQECTVCASYGDGFMEVVAGYLSELNTESFSPVSIDECFELCRNRTEFVCKTIDYVWPSSSCHLSDSSALDVADKFFFDWGFVYNLSHFQRDCATV